MLKTEITDVTPATAAVWLDKHNTQNRPLNQNSVKRFSSDMKKGGWHWDNGVPIVLSSKDPTDKNNQDFIVLDGQHRLAAIVQSGVTASGVLVSSGVDRSLFSTYDCGKQRTLADAFYVDNLSEGVTKALAVTFSAVAKTLANNEAGNILAQRANLPTVYTQLEEAEKKGWDVASLHPLYKKHFTLIKDLNKVMGFPERVSLVAIILSQQEGNEALLDHLYYMSDPAEYHPPATFIKLVINKITAEIREIHKNPLFARGRNRTIEGVIWVNLKLLVGMVRNEVTRFTAPAPYTKAYSDLIFRGINPKTGKPLSCVLSFDVKNRATPRRKERAAKK